MTQIFDVVIVGAGPAGCALGTYLAREGYSALLLEKERFPRDKVCGDLVSARALAALADLGCYDEIVQRAYVPIQESEVRIDDELLVRTPLPQVRGYPPFGHAIPRFELDELVFSKALAAGARAVEECTVLGYETGRSTVAIEASVGGHRRRFLGRMIVGADGATSIVARSARLDMRDPRYVQIAVRAYCHGLPLRHAVLFVTEDFFPGYGWIFPVHDTLANVGVGMVSESARKDGIRVKEFYARFTAFIRRMAAKLNVRIELTPPKGWPIKTYGGAHRNFFDRGLLIGDAGCFVDPMSGEGIPFAFETAGMAAATIRDAFAAGDFCPASLSRFEQRWRSRYDADLSLSDLAVSMIRNRRLVRLWINWLRVIGLTASRDRQYALTIGGILAGLVPSREGFSPEIILKSFAHGPRFWMDALDVSPDSPATDFVRQGVNLLKWQTELAASIATDFDWFSNWALEITSKQLKVISLLGGRIGNQVR